MRLIVIPARDGGLGQAWPLVLDQTACALEAKDAGGGFGRHAELGAEPFAEVTTAPTQVARQALYRNTSVRLRQPAPRPGEFARRGDGNQRPDKFLIQDGETSLPRSS